MSSERADPSELVGVIDVGSNTIKLLLAGRGKTEAIEIKDFIVEETRIGEGMTGHPPEIDSDALQRGSEAIQRLVKKAEKHTKTLCVVATSAVRDATNKNAFVNAVEAACGHELRILSGSEEASLIGYGLRCDPKMNALDSYSLIDLGGGSLECIQFYDRAMVRSQSLRLGSVRLASLFVSDRNVPLSEKDHEKIRAHVLQQWQQSIIPRASSPSNLAVITGGTSSVLAKTINQEPVSLPEFEAICLSIQSADTRKRIKKFGIPKSRADIFPTATVTLMESLRYLGCDQIRFSDYNLRHGIVSMLLEHGAIHSPS